MSYKQVIVVRRDLKLRKGEIAALVAKVSASFFTDNDESEKVDELLLRLSPEESSWLFGDPKRIVLGVGSEDALHRIISKAEIHGLNVYPHYRNISDKISNQQIDCVAIGPHDEEAIDAITSNLKLI